MDHVGRLYVGDDNGSLWTSDVQAKDWSEVIRQPEAVHALAFDRRGFVFLGGDSDTVLLSKDYGKRWTEYSLDGLLRGVFGAHFVGITKL